MIPPPDPILNKKIMFYNYTTSIKIHCLPSQIQMDIVHKKTGYEWWGFKGFRCTNINN